MRRMRIGPSSRVQGGALACVVLLLAATTATRGQSGGGFSQTVDLARRLAAAKVQFEEIVNPDDTHHWMRHANVLRVYNATADCFERRLRAADRSQ